MADPPARFPSACDAPSPKSRVTDRSALLDVGFVTVKTTVAVLLVELACTAEQLPDPVVGVHVSVTVGPDRTAIVRVLLVFVPAVALTTLCCDVVSVVRASPAAFVMAVVGLRIP